MKYNEIMKLTCLLIESILSNKRISVSKQEWKNILKTISIEGTEEARNISVQIIDRLNN